MRKIFVPLTIALIAVHGFAGFKPKLIKAKKAEQFEARAAAGNATYAADLLTEAKDQKEYFYKELTPSSVIAVRLAVFNSGRDEVLLPLDAVQLVGPDGQEVPLVPPETVAHAVLGGMVVSAKQSSKGPVSASPGVAAGDPRTNPRDPRYDPTADPRDPRYDPRTNPRDPRYDPRMDPNDPRYDPTGPRVGRDPRYDPNDPRSRDPRYDPNDPRNDPTSPYPRTRGYGGYGGPSIILNPGGGRGGGGDLSQFERTLVEKDFSDKAHAPEPILPSLTRDRFLFFSLASAPASHKGFTLRIPPGKGIPAEVLLKF
jgi:hypothetical protein